MWPLILQEDRPLNTLLSYHLQKPPHIRPEVNTGPAHHFIRVTPLRLISLELKYARHWAKYLNCVILLNSYQLKGVINTSYSHFNEESGVYKSYL